MQLTSQISIQKNIDIFMHAFREPLVPAATALWSPPSCHRYLPPPSMDLWSPFLGRGRQGRLQVAATKQGVLEVSERELQVLWLSDGLQRLPGGSGRQWQPLEVKGRKRQIASTEQQAPKVSRRRRQVEVTELWALWGWWGWQKLAATDQRSPEVSGRHLYSLY